MENLAISMTFFSFGFLINEKFQNLSNKTPKASLKKKLQNNPLNLQRDSNNISFTLRVEKTDATENLHSYSILDRCFCCSCTVLFGIKKENITSESCG